MDQCSIGNLEPAFHLGVAWNAHIGIACSLVCHRHTRHIDEIKSDGAKLILLATSVNQTIIGFVVFIELSKRKIPVQHAGKGGGSAAMARASFLPIKINSAGVIPVIFASSILSAPAIIASFISKEAASAEWLLIFNYNRTFSMPWFDGTHWEMNWGLFIYLALIIAFCFFYAEMQIDPENLADNFQKNGSYIPGIRPGKETERYVRKVLNRVTFLGAISLSLIAALPIILVWANVFDGDNSLALGGTGLIIIVGVALEINAQIDGLLAGKSFDKVKGIQQ